MHEYFQVILIKYFLFKGKEISNQGFTKSMAEFCQAQLNSFYTEPWFLLPAPEELPKYYKVVNFNQVKCNSYKI